MATFEDFEQQLRDALAHLHDPTYQPAEVMWNVLGSYPQQRVEFLQSTVSQAIEDLKPGPDIPASARGRRIYELLSCRYLKEMTQGETAEHLGITSRHLRREQQQAVHLLARRLWEKNRVVERSSTHLPATSQTQLSETEAVTEWRSQVRQELASLQHAAPGLVANIEDATRAMLELGPALTSDHMISLEMGEIEPNLAVSIHPSVLRQILITAVESMIQQMSSGQIVFAAERMSGNIKISITGQPVRASNPPGSEFIDEIVAMQDGSVEVCQEGDSCSFWIELPAADKITVLVIDDNADQVHFYRRYTLGTRYEITHLVEGQKAFEAIENFCPDIILLDVMLPDIDGWELLAHLRKHTIASQIPIIICSVVKRPELARALGADHYLAKPIRRQQLIQALDQALIGL